MMSLNLDFYRAEIVSQITQLIDADVVAIWCSQTENWRLSSVLMHLAQLQYKTLYNEYSAAATKPSNGFKVSSEIKEEPPVTKTSDLDNIDSPDIFFGDESHLSCNNDSLFNQNIHALNSPTSSAELSEKWESPTINRRKIVRQVRVNYPSLASSTGGNNSNKRNHKADVSANCSRLPQRKVQNKAMSPKRILKDRNGVDTCPMVSQMGVVEDITILLTPTRNAVIDKKTPKLKLDFDNEQQCKDCRKYYTCDRHNGIYVPEPTPPGIWDLTFPKEKQ